MNLFNLRVYGILINTQNEVLLMDEKRFGISFTKFPGGGLEWGEGLEACLMREFKEELCLDIIVKDLFYVNPFFVQSAFNTQEQLISFYYLVIAKDLQMMSANSLDEQPRWSNVDTIDEKDITFPIDKEVLKLLKQKKRD